MIFLTTLRWLNQNINESVKSQITPYTASIQNWPRYNGTGLYLSNILLQTSNRHIEDPKKYLVHVMAWCGTGDKPLPEPMMHTVHTMLCSVVVWHQLILPISFRNTSFAPEQCYNWPSISEATLKNMSNRAQEPTHYSDVIMGAMASKITSLTIVYWTVYSGADKKNIKAPRHWPLCGEFTGDRWIPHINGQ